MNVTWVSHWTQPEPDLPEVAAFLAAPPVRPARGWDLLTYLLDNAEARDRHRIDAAEDLREGREP